jgi:hypothetical protein
MMHSNKEHVIERWDAQWRYGHVSSHGRGSVMFTKPWVMNPRTTQIAPGDDISPTFCMPFDRTTL